MLTRGDERGDPTDDIFDAMYPMDDIDFDAMYRDIEAVAVERGFLPKNAMLLGYMVGVTECGWPRMTYDERALFVDELRRLAEKSRPT